MKERGIIMTGESVRAILDGRKTQTRRVVNPRLYIEVFDGQAYDTIEQSDPSFAAALVEHVRCPYGAPGDRLWVRETWAPLGTSGAIYRADDHDQTEGYMHVIQNGGRWRSPIHMPRWASRLLLELTEVRVGRVQDISEVDALAEGCDCRSDLAWGVGLGVVDDPYQAAVEHGYRADFERRWREINDKRPGCAWAANPWVWALTFRRV